MRRKLNRKCFLPSTLYPNPSTLRRGQTAIEYLLVTVALTVAFATVYSVLQTFLARQFEQGGGIIVRMYDGRS